MQLAKQEQTCETSIFFKDLNFQNPRSHLKTLLYIQSLLIHPLTPVYVRVGVPYLHEYCICVRSATIKLKQKYTFLAKNLKSSGVFIRPCLHSTF